MGKVLQGLFLCGLVAGFVKPAFPQSQPADGVTYTRVAFPQDYAKTFRLYDKVDKVDRKIVRFLYVNPDALSKVKDGEPFPNGTILVMEDHAVAQEAGGNPLKSSEGRLIPTQRVRSISVMEKRAGWGETNLFPAEKDNGDWEHALFRPDGTSNPIKLDNCYSCHVPQNRDGLDFTFSGAKIREAARK
jgi:hypothetical protein